MRLKFIASTHYTTADGHPIAAPADSVPDHDFSEADARNLIGCGVAEPFEPTETEVTHVDEPSGAGPDAPAERPADETETDLVCEDCGRGPFANAGALGAHRKAKH